MAISIFPVRYHASRLFGMVETAAVVFSTGCFYLEVGRRIG